MFGFLLDVASAIIGAVLPIYRTWKVLKSRKTTQLVPLAKYWIIFGIANIVETVAAAFYIPYWLPGYSLLRFGAIIYIFTSGYNHIYDSVVSPFLAKQEPLFGQLLTVGAQYGAQLTTSFLRGAIQYTFLSISTNNGLNFAGYTAVHASSYNEPAPTAHESFIEVQEECEIMYPMEVKQEILDDGYLSLTPTAALTTQNILSVDDLPIQIMSKKGTVRRSSRVRKASKN